MPKKRRSLIIIPPKKGRIRYIRIHFGLLVFFIILMLISLAGYFIPEEKIHLTTEEINQKRHLAEQNNKLIRKIRRMHKMMGTLGNELDSLSNMRKGVEGLLDTKQKNNDSVANKIDTIFKGNDLDLILNYAIEQDKFLKKLIVRINNDPALINSVPLIRPLADESIITARHGEMFDPFTSSTKKHNGLDFSADEGSKIIAVADGVVEKISNNNTWGKKIVIRHKFGFKTIYAHLGEVKTASGRSVKRGDVIATVGISGLSTGPHLHYEILHKGESINPELLLSPTDTSNGQISYH